MYSLQINNKIILYVGILRKAAESHIWVVPSRLSYSVYLVHFNIVHVLIGSKQYTSDIGTFMLVRI